MWLRKSRANAKMSLARSIATRNEFKSARNPRATSVIMTAYKFMPAPATARALPRSRRGATRGTQRASRRARSAGRARAAAAATPDTIVGSESASSTNGRSNTAPAHTARDGTGTHRRPHHTTSLTSAHARTHPAGAAVPQTHHVTSHARECTNPAGAAASQTHHITSHARARTPREQRRHKHIAPRRARHSRARHRL